MYTTTPLPNHRQFSFVFFVSSSLVPRSFLLLICPSLQTTGSETRSSSRVIRAGHRQTTTPVPVYDSALPNLPCDTSSIPLLFQRYSLHFLCFSYSSLCFHFWIRSRRTKNERFHTLLFPSSNPSQCARYGGYFPFLSFGFLGCSICPLSPVPFFTSQPWHARKAPRK